MKSIKVVSLMEENLKILILINKIGKYPKHQPKIDMITSLEKHADIFYWHGDGHIKDILNTLKLKPDFIFHYDIAWNYGLAPMVEGLGEVGVPTGCFVIDLHWNPNERIQYFEDNKIDLIFSATKHPFLSVFPQYKKKLRWLPWSINSNVMKDYQLKKDINTLLMGLVFIDPSSHGKHVLPKKAPPKNRSAFRNAVFN